MMSDGKKKQVKDNKKKKRAREQKDRWKFQANRLDFIDCYKLMKQNIFSL